MSAADTLMARCNQVKQQAQSKLQDRIQASEIIRNQLKATVDRLVDSQIQGLNSQYQFILDQTDGLIKEFEKVKEGLPQNTQGGRMWNHLSNNPNTEVENLIAIENVWEDKLDSVVQTLMTVFRADMNLRVKDFTQTTSPRGLGWNRLSKQNFQPIQPDSIDFKGKTHKMMPYYHDLLEAHKAFKCPSGHRNKKDLYLYRCCGNVYCCFDCHNKHEQNHPMSFSNKVCVICHKFLGRNDDCRC